MPGSTTLCSDLDRIFAHLDRNDAPGAAVGVIRDQRILYARGFGLANVEHGVPNSTSTLFDVASITKQFTAHAVQLLVHDGRLGLDDAVRDHLPTLPDYQPAVRIRHCLAHSSGLTDWIHALEFTGPADDYCSAARALSTICSLEGTMFDAGSEHLYCNTGYVVLSHVVAQVTGESLPAFLQARVFDPLGMSSSMFRSSCDDFFPNEAQGYFRDADGTLGTGRWPTDAHGDGGLRSNVEDLLKWLQHLGAGESNGDPVVAACFEACTLDEGQPTAYAPGWELQRYRGVDFVRHGGLESGYEAHIALSRDMRLGVVVLGNVVPVRPWPLVDKVLDVCIDSPITTGSVAVVPRGAVDDPSTNARNGARPLVAGGEALCGRYFTATGMPVTVAMLDDRIRLDVWYTSRLLTPRAMDVFDSSEGDETVIFHRNADGGVVALSIERDDGACVRLHSPLRYASRFELVEPDAQALSALEGRYLSDELETLYTLVATSSGLIARHTRCYEWQLSPARGCMPGWDREVFIAEGGWPGQVIFDRDANGDVTGFRTIGLCHSLYFRKLRDPG